jgi:hypothetical protein
LIANGKIFETNESVHAVPPFHDEYGICIRKFRSSETLVKRCLPKITDAMSKLASSTKTSETCESRQKFPDEFGKGRPERAAKRDSQKENKE